jgi:hypothetical protein
MENLKKNLMAIAPQNPSLYERLLLPVGSDHVRFEGNELHYQYRQNWRHLLATPLDDSRIEAYLGQNSLLLFGCGLADQLDVILKHHFNRLIICWERDPWLLRLFLMKRDYTNEISTGRIVFSLGADIFEIAAKPVSEAKIVADPLARQFYPNEYHLVLHGRQMRQLMLCRGDLYVDDTSEIFQAAGWSVYTWDLARIALEESAYLFKKGRPDLIMSINYPVGLAEFCEERQVPMICWEVDPSIDVLPPLPAPTRYSHIFSYRQPNLDEFGQAGFGSRHLIPLATNLKKRQPLELTPAEWSKYQAPVSFVGSSMTDTATVQWQTFINTYQSGEAQSEDVQRQKNMAIFDRIIEEQSHNWNEFLIAEIGRKYLNDVQPGGPDNPRKEFDWVMLIGETAASLRRLYFVKKLIAAGIQVWGDEGWKVLESDALHYRGPAGHGAELTRIYNASRINIDIGRFYQKDIVPMRIFDILACGGFVIAEQNAALDELFVTGEELESYRTIEELLDKVSYYQTHPDQAKAIGQRGRLKVIARHSIEQRLREMFATANLSDLTPNFIG